MGMDPNSNPKPKETRMKSSAYGQYLLKIEKSANFQNRPNMSFYGLK